MKFSRALIWCPGLLCGVLLLGSGCTETAPTGGSSPATSAAPVSPSASPVTSPTPSSPAPRNVTIAAEGIGPARLGMTLGELKQALPEATFEVVSPFIVDFDAIAVSQNDAVQFYVLYLAGDSFGDSDVIQGLLTENPDYETAQGVGPGTTLERAQQVYGTATLSYNTANESREYVRFERHPAPSLSFGTGSFNADAAGIYPTATAEYNETQQFKPDATIQSVLVVCLADGCTPPAVQ